jgi:hypothetical protein
VVAINASLDVDTLLLSKTDRSRAVVLASYMSDYALHIKAFTSGWRASTQNVRDRWKELCVDRSAKAAYILMSVATQYYAKEDPTDNQQASEISTGVSTNYGYIISLQSSQATQGSEISGLQTQVGVNTTAGVTQGRSDANVTGICMARCYY